MNTRPLMAGREHCMDASEAAEQAIKVLLPARLTLVPPPTLIVAHLRAPGSRAMQGWRLRPPSPSRAAAQSALLGQRLPGRCSQPGTSAPPQGSS